MTSRIFSVILAAATNFASKEITAAEPYVKTAISSIPADIVAKNPLAAFTGTLHAATTAMTADPNVVPSLTGLIASCIEQLWGTLGFGGNGTAAAIGLKADPANAGQAKTVGATPGAKT